MLRTGLLKPGNASSGNLNWTRNERPAGNIGYTYDMVDVDGARLVLIYSTTVVATGKQTDHRQMVPLCSTDAQFGGRRWWMRCPVNGDRVANLYCPLNGDIFASRRAWRLGYRSQRVAARDRPFERLFSLQTRLGCKPGWEAPIFRPKGMWHRTFARHQQRYWELDRQCAAEGAAMLARLGG